MSRVLQRCVRNTWIPRPTHNHDMETVKHTSSKQSHRCKGPIFRLKPLQQGYQSQRIQERMEKAFVNHGVGIKPVHYKSEKKANVVSTRFFRNIRPINVCIFLQKGGFISTYYSRSQFDPESMHPIVPRPKPSAIPAPRTL